MADATGAGSDDEPLFDRIVQQLKEKGKGTVFFYFLTRQLLKKNQKNAKRTSQWKKNVSVSLKNYN